MNPGIAAAVSIVAGLLLALGVGIAVRLPGVSDWHDSQRILQCTLLFAAGVTAVLLPAVRHHLRLQGARWGRAVAAGVSVALIAGALSAATSGFARASLLEVACFTLTLLVLVPAVMAAREADPQRFDRVVLTSLVLCTALLVPAFLVAWLAAVGDAAGYRPELLWRHGFSNPRFLGQFHTLVLPLLACACVLSVRPPRARALAFAVLAGSWLLALFTATRATWYALAIASVVMLLAIPRLSGRMLLPQALALGVALPCAWLMFEWWPGAIARAPEATLDALAGRLADPFDLRLRDVLWARALSLATAQPLLGVGPMGLALDPSPVAAHPHSVLLQLASEWGLLATVALAVALGAAAGPLLRGFRDRVPEGSHAGRNPGGAQEALLGAALLLSLLAGLIHAQVDGLLVMPVPQLLFALLVGWVGSMRLPAADPLPRPPTAAARVAGAAVPAVCVVALIAGAGPEVTGLQSRTEQRERDCPELAGSTRFWVEGSLWDEAGPPRRFTPLAPPPGCRPGHSTGATPR